MTVHVQGPVEGRRAEAAARDAEVVRWRKMRAGGRSAFVWRHGVVGWGLPAAIVTAAYKVIERLGLGWPSELPPDLHVPLALIALVFPALGWVLGGWLWTQGEARHRALLRERGEGPPDPV